MQSDWVTSGVVGETLEILRTLMQKDHLRRALEASDVVTVSRIDDAVSELVATITLQAARSSRSRCDTTVKVRWFAALATISGLPAPGWRLRVFLSLLSAVEKHSITLLTKASCGGSTTQSHKVGILCGCSASLVV